MQWLLMMESIINPGWNKGKKSFFLFVSNARSCILAPVQRVKESKSQRVKESKSQRVKESKSQRVKESKS